MFGSFFSRGVDSGTKPETGGDARDDGIAYGYAAMRGKRPQMEDYHQAKLAKEKYNGQPVALFGVFDGHGGAGAADYIRTHLFPNLLQHPRFPGDVHGAMSEVFKATDHAYMSSDIGYGRDDGSTATVACIIGRVGAGRLIVANVGDSRGVLCRDGRAVAMSIDHKPNRSDERQRIESAGGVVVWAGTWRVGGVLAVSRAFGDRLLKRYVTAEPEIKDEPLTSHDEFLLLASDGMWDVMPNQEAVNLVRHVAHPEEMARLLTEEAFRRGSVDNITCLAVRFRTGEGSGQGNPPSPGMHSPGHMPSPVSPQQPYGTAPAVRMTYYVG